MLQFPGSGYHFITRLNGSHFPPVQNRKGTYFNKQPLYRPCINKQGVNHNQLIENNDRIDNPESNEQFLPERQRGNVFGGYSVKKSVNANQENHQRSHDCKK